MAKLRISIVEFLNTAPLVWGFTDGPLQGKYELSFAVPSQCAEDLRAGRADVGIIPAIEYQRMEDVVALPGMAIASKQEVRSLLVISKVPIDLAKSFALDTNSRSSVGLARILCQRHWDIDPEFIDMPPDPDGMLARADAALVIGDPALRLRLRGDALQAKVPGAAARCCSGGRGGPACPRGGPLGGGPEAYSRRKWLRFFRPRANTAWRTSAILPRGLR